MDEKEFEQLAARFETPNQPTAYTILGVEPGAADAEIKKAYRDLAAQYHPDQNPGNQAAEARFKEISAAYDDLRYPDRRAAYDQAHARDIEMERLRKDIKGF